MRKLPGFTDVNSDQQNNGLQASLVYDRLTAARLGLTPQMIDNTLYDAFGQSQVSTMYTALNQYHVVMEVDPKFWQSPQRTEQHLPPLDQRRAGSLERHRPVRAHHRPDHREPPGPVSLR